MLHKIPVFTHNLCLVMAVLCLCGFLCSGVDATVAMPDSPEGSEAVRWALCGKVEGVDIFIYGSVVPGSMVEGCQQWTRRVEEEGRSTGQGE